MNNFYAYATRRIREKRVAGQHNTADLYRTTRNWVCRFAGGKGLSLRQITAGFVERFAAYLRRNGLRENSVSTYLSNLRALYNRARKEGYPFPGRESPFAFVTLRRERTASRALDVERLAEIVALHPDDPEQARAIDYCTFCYLACGMPFADLARLTRDNIRQGILTYKRKKTGARISVYITPAMRRLIDKYASDSSPYLFPILPHGETVGHETYKSRLRAYNNTLRQLGRGLSQPIHLTSYVFRHTWATHALRKQVPVAVISQSLGHTSERTTRFYLGSLDQSDLDQANERVTRDIALLLEAG